MTMLSFFFLDSTNMFIPLHANLSRFSRPRP